MRATLCRRAPALLAPVLLAACGLPGAPQPPSLQLPKPVGDLRAVRVADKVSLTWTPPSQTTDRQRVRGMGATRVCRTIEDPPPPPADRESPPGCTQFLAALVTPAAPRDRTAAAPATYVDTLPEALQREHPLGVAVYTVEVLNDHGRTAGPSNAAPTPLAPTLPAPGDLRAALSHDGVTLTWTGSPASAAVATRGISFRYRVLRAELNNARAREASLGTVAADDATTYRFDDRTLEWEHQYRYRVEGETVVEPRDGSAQTIAGTPSAPVDVNAHDVYPPTTPTGVQAIFTETSGTRFVDLTWLPGADADLAGYNVYRHESGAAPQKINTELVKTPTFRDTGIVPGRRYFYSITAVDVRGNESARSEEASELVPQP